VSGTVIEAFGSTSLVQVGRNYYFYPVGGNPDGGGGGGGGGGALKTAGDDSVGNEPVEVIRGGSGPSLPVSEVELSAAAWRGGSPG
jgi:hypothetical protein